MYYRQKFDTFIRIYDEIGYITNKSNFRDHVTDKSGAVFLKALSRKPKNLFEIVSEIENIFINASPLVIKQDVKDFYQILEEDGFIVSGESEEELDRKDKRFSYSEYMPKIMHKDFTPNILRANNNSQDFLENYFKNKPQLTLFQIELTSRCNERCLHCYIPHENKINDIEPILFYDVLEQCHDMGVLNITFSGGEPLIHPKFNDYLRKAKEYDFSITVLSNLTLLNNEIIAEMKASRLSSVQVSLYSMNADIHDAITQLPGSFIKTRDAILKLIENDIPLQINCPTMKQNKNCFIDVLKWGHENKVRVITDYIMMARYDHTTDNLDNRLNFDEAAKIIQDIILNDTEYKKNILESSFKTLEKADISNDIVCGVCISSLCMVANGNIYPCAGWQNLIFGNLYKEKLKNIWDDSEGVKYLRGLRKKDFPKCVDCEDRSFCAMCMVRNANEDSDGNPLNVNDHFCKIAALNRKIVLDWKANHQVAQ